MNIDSIENGYVIDHIPAGKGMQIYNVLSLPKEIKNIVKCPNPRCISNNEDIDHIFKLTDDKGTYRCLYCETMAL